MQNVFFLGGGVGGGVNKVYYGNVKVANKVEKGCIKTRSTAASFHVSNT